MMKDILGNLDNAPFKIMTGCIAGLLSCGTVAQSTVQQSIQQSVDRHFKPLMAQYQIPGMAIAVSINGQHYYQNYGVASKQTEQNVSEHTLFELGSVSKLFNATLTGYAQAQGQLQLSDHPAQYFPELKNTAVNQATLLNLGTYTAGGFPLQFPEQIKTTQDMTQYFQHWQPKAAPGRIREYSNPSIGLMGYVTALAMKNSYSNLIENTLFPTLGMHHSYINVPAAQMSNYAWGYQADQAIRVSPGMFDAEAYGIKSNTADMLKFLDAQINPQNLKLTLRKAIQTTQMGYFQVGQMRQGLGWEQYTYPVSLTTLLAGNSAKMALQPQPVTGISKPITAPQQALLNKTGATNGFSAYVVVIPSQKIGLVMLANRNFPNDARVKAAYATLQQILNADIQK